MLSRLVSRCSSSRCAPPRRASSHCLPSRCVATREAHRHGVSRCASCRDPFVTRLVTGRGFESHSRVGRAPRVVVVSRSHITRNEPSRTLYRPVATYAAATLRRLIITDSFGNRKAMTPSTHSGGAPRFKADAAGRSVSSVPPGRTGRGGVRRGQRPRRRKTISRSPVRSDHLVVAAFRRSGHAEPAAEWQNRQRK